MDKLCSIDGCSRRRKSRGLCSGHYERYRLQGEGFDKSPLIEYGAALRFLEDIVANPPEGCVLWPFARIPNGYGTVTFEGRTQYAHRVACQKFHGPPPSPTHEAAHGCGNGHLACMNPRCLRWATPKQNHADLIIHGTDNRGEKHYATKLTANDVREIRRIYNADQTTYQAIADSYGVSRGAIRHIVVGATWQHVT